MNYIFLGPPGSGKGTQAERLAKKHHAIYFGTGDMMREEARLGTNLGQKFQEIWDKGTGELIPEDLVNEFVINKISELDQNQEVIFDGYPRSLKQAEAFVKAFDEKSFRVININVSLKNLIERLSTRRICSKCGKVFFRADISGQKICDSCGNKLIQRQDDRPEVIKKRIDVYQKETQPLIDYYKSQNLLIDINGNPPIDKVEKEIEEKLND